RRVRMRDRRRDRRNRAARQARRGARLRAQAGHRQPPRRGPRMNDTSYRIRIGGGDLTVTVDAAEQPSDSGRVILVPAFGMSAERMFPAAYLLAANGFEVHRFDPRDHPGASTGSTATFPLTR